MPQKASVLAMPDVKINAAPTPEQIASWQEAHNSSAAVFAKADEALDDPAHKIGAVIETNYFCLPAVEARAGSHHLHIRSAQAFRWRVMADMRLIERAIIEYLRGYRIHVACSGGDFYVGIQSANAFTTKGEKGGSKLHVQVCADDKSELIQIGSLASHIQQAIK